MLRWAHRDNKNKYVLGYLYSLAARGVFKRIELSFLPVGHTHEVSKLRAMGWAVPRAHAVIDFSLWFRIVHEAGY